MDLTGQIRIAVMLGIHASQNGFQKSDIIQIFLRNRIGLKQYLQISDAGGKEIMMQHPYAILTFFRPVQLLCLFSDILPF